MAHYFNSEWRRVAAALYRKPVDSKIFGTVVLDVTDAEAFVQQQRQSGLKITLTHLLLLAAARGVRDAAPELNTYIRRGAVVERDSIDVSLSVLIKGGEQMGSVMIRQADQFTLPTLAAYLEKEIPASRKGAEKGAMKMKKIIAAIPWPFRGWILDLLRRLTVDGGLSIPRWGVSANSFGTFIFSNIGSVGLDIGYPALLPSSNVAFVLIMGSINTQPAVVEGQIVPRRILHLSAALDHRVVDAAHGGKLFRYIKSMIRTPERLMEADGM